MPTKLIWTSEILWQCGDTKLVQLCQGEICRHAETRSAFFYYFFLYEFFPHARTHGDPLQHSLFELAVDGQHLGVADKGEGQDGDSVGRLWKLIKKKKISQTAAANRFLEFETSHPSFAGKHRHPELEHSSKPCLR